MCKDNRIHNVQNELHIPKKELCLFFIHIYSYSKVIYLESRELVSLSWQSAIPGHVMENNSVMKDTDKRQKCKNRNMLCI